MKNKKLLELNIFTQIIILLMLTFVVYSNTLKNGFVIEDPIYITDWKLTQSLGNIGKMFAGDTSPTENIGVYRPMRGVFYVLSYRLWGGTNPTFYHIQALLVHLGITVLVYFIAREILLNAKRLTTNAGNENHALSVKHSALSNLPFITALLFGLHPVHTEAIDYLTASFDTAAYIFFFGSFYLYLLFLKSYRLGGGKNGFYIASIGLAALAFFHFEMTLTLPFLIVLYDLTLGGTKGQRDKVHKVDAVTKSSVSLNTLSTLSLGRYVPYFAVAFIYLFIRVVILGITARSGYLEGSFYLTMLTMAKVFLKYLEMLFAPINLSINPRLVGGISAWPHPLAYMERISSQSIFEPIILLSLLILAGLILAVVYFRRRQPFVSFSIGWFLISLLPVSYIIPQNTIFQERYIYIASFGYILLLVFLFDYFYTHKKLFKIKNYTQKVLIALIILVAAFYGFGTYFRNKDWEDSLAVWSKLAKQYPEDVIANFDTANLYAQRNNFDQAVAYYQKALAIEPGLHEVRFGLGEIYEKQGKFDQAAVEYQQAILVNFDFEPAREALARLNGREEDQWVSCKLSKISFSCPKSWTRSTSGSGVKLSEPKGNFTVVISLDKMAAGSVEDYLKLKTESYGELVNQGLASIPGVESAYVRVWQRDKGIEEQRNKVDKGTGTESAQSVNNQPNRLVLMQFFLFKGDRVVEILVYPAESPLMVKFDRIVSSITID